MPIIEPSGVDTFSPKILDQSLVRRFISQNGMGYVALGIMNGQTPVDADVDSVALQVWFNDVSAPQPQQNPWGVQIIDVSGAQIKRADVGKYSYDIGPQFTKDRGILTAQWTYSVGGTQFTYLDHLQILNPMPLYDTFNDQEKSVVEQVTWMIGDLFDSTDGGPWLKENFQTHFDYERIAQMQKLAVQRMNLTGWPVTYWDVGTNPVTNSFGTNVGGSVPPTFAGLTTFGTYLEVVRHLRDSYVEIPAFQQMNVTYTDRRDYMERWAQVYQAEWPEYKKMVTMAKRKLLNLGRGSLLVAGGIYGGNALGLFQVGTYASQVRSWRFYPAAPAMFWGATHAGGR